ncbi:MAG: hypothetical protein QXU18_01500 [Thermoplasmatales archaeon]
MKETGLEEYPRHLEIALKVHNLAEIGSREFESSKLLMGLLANYGFKITYNFMNMSTAFKAEKIVVD